MWDKNSPFMARQLEALVTPDVFKMIDWPGIVQARPTPLKDAFHSTFRDPVYSKGTLEF